ncbi:hypothetical protein BS47DRAFT_580054 [Hydnum rufescens UP504]|uniref:Uncharacterized protein n=1 Tax=Hydnum rufescens UP504 TaxID=1448309 RepID=A0A9P6AHI2_9AGAM|nr:hypothetical protein BS47DRAFT_580054 [Hydnum rufescens UP504]
MTLWLRVERAAKRAQSGIRSLFSTFPAKDTARICGSEQDILYEEEPSMVEADIRFESPPTLLDLEKLLTIVAEESVEYKLWPENCFFFAAAIQENLSTRHGGYLFSGKQELKNLAQDVRARIRARFEAS